MSPSTLSSAFVAVNHAAAPGPVVVSIPHAGRIYPQEILDAARVPQPILEQLEDRWCDLIAAKAVEAGASVVTALYARAVADCNRGEWQMAAAEVAPDLQRHLGAPGPKERAGLGVVPSRLAGAGLLWKRPINFAQLQQRLDMIHRPYHLQLAAKLDAARASHGIAILIDLHSMPSISRGHIGHGQSMIIGDRFGASSGGWLAGMARNAATSLGCHTGFNRPYAGGYVLERHATPANGIYGVQLELDRALYLSADRLPDPVKIDRLSGWLSELIASVSDPRNWPNNMELAAE